MEDFKTNKKEQEIVFSKAIKAGKRIYYLDVKRSRNDDLFIAITESKKKIQGDEENPLVSFEKHKIFLYKEDFSKFANALTEVIEYIEENRPQALNQTVNDEEVATAAEVEAPAEMSDFSENNVSKGKYEVDMDFGI